MLRENPGFVQASLSDPFEATRQTILYMCGLAHNSQQDPVISEAAQDALVRFSALVGDSTSPAGKAECVWWWVKHALKFVHHKKLFKLWHAGDGQELQLLISPDTLLHMEKPRGDCAVFTTLICAMLDSLAVPWDIVTLATERESPEIFSHVYPRALLGNGICIPLDASHGKYPGWEVPKRRQFSRQVWNRNGEPIADMDSGFRGLHDMNWDNDGGNGMAGLGQDPSVDGDVTYTETTTTTDSGGGSNSSAPTAAELALLNSGMSLVGKIVAPTTTYTGPGGVSLTTPTGSPTANSLSALLGGNLLGTTGTGVSSSVLLLGGLALGAVLLISMMGKK